MGTGFKMPTERGELKRLSKEIVASAAPLHNLKFTNRVTASCIGLLVVQRRADLDYYHVLKEMHAEESADCAGALLALVSFTASYALCGFHFLYSNPLFFVFSSTLISFTCTTSPLQVILNNNTLKN